jgi:hypothetical protein
MKSLGLHLKNGNEIPKANLMKGLSKKCQSYRTRPLGLGLGY